MKSCRRKIESFITVVPLIDFQISTIFTFRNLIRNIMAKRFHGFHLCFDACVGSLSKLINPFPRDIFHYCRDDIFYEKNSALEKQRFFVFLISVYILLYIIFKFVCGKEIYLLVNQVIGK